MNFRKIFMGGIVKKTDTMFLRFLTPLQESPFVSNCHAKY